MEKIRPITNPRNNLIRFIRSLKKKRTREEKCKFLIEGINSIKEALKTDIEIPYFVYSLDLYRVSGGKELIEDLQQRGERLLLVSEAIFNKLSETKTPQGILAVPSRLKWEEKNIMEAKKSFVFVLVGIQDPGNMGTVVRISDALAMDGIIVSEDSVDHYNPKTVRSTMGAIFRMPIYKTDDIREYLKKMKDNGFKIISTTLSDRSQVHDSPDYSSMDKIAIIMGNEANGIPEDICEFSDLQVKIPILGKIDSLNIGVSAGIISYEVIRQKGWRPVNGDKE
ncbi:MAG: 23S rRNA (guanosine(2251)-2'-O)-methyltransferase RlmB [Candidatus Muiribacterium halophilum]|uniref:23S rRNA (Guanosine(2251)-2'-O)-methyltransferase RlmB n=1 Tax=Muiribacterium halophilum TaxID=2053465 RepID=A0A2N5ZGA4_MUIH1|nr:MAG: 23S rRNA (guanosine(2251)-2'-O)-methyltransferase RlmB [Candidatus Muirbacterium halophilum]